MNSKPYTIFSPAEDALTFSLGNMIDRDLHSKIIAIKNYVQKNPFRGLKDIVVAYCSVTIIYDAWSIYENNVPSPREFVQLRLDEAYQHSIEVIESKSRVIDIPVCYDEEFGLDLRELSVKSKMSVDEIVSTHMSLVYDVFMIGFLPGFGYMASVDERIAFPRRESPRQVVAAGSVGIAGVQTGIYPVNSPGGWQIIGKTPLIMFDKNSERPSLLQAGDRVKFRSISKEEYRRIAK